MRRILAITAFCCALLCTSGSSKAQAPNKNHSSKTSSGSGRSTFNASCAGCHGLDGHGGDKAPNIATSARVRHFSDAELAGIISNGLPGTGMPAFHTLSTTQVHDLVGYLRSLQGKVEAGAVSGNAQHGKEIFFGKGNCSDCHTISGQGGFLGPDLTNHAATSSAAGIREEIVKSPRVPATGYRSAVLVTAAGKRFEGLIRNEDNFSVQLQTKDGSFHFFKKASLQKIEYVEGSLMPSDYGQRLSNAELNDLASYLMTTSDPTKVPARRKDDFE